jgi:hypothetical protein
LFSTVGRSLVEKLLEDFGESGEEAYRVVGCRDIRRFAGF